MLSVEPLKAYDDNYIWLVSTNEGSIVIDPGESNKIINKYPDRIPIIVEKHKSCNYDTLQKTKFLSPKKI